MADQDQDEPLIRGQKIGGFEIVRLCASGGMGKVYLVRHPFYKMDLALKVMLNSLRGVERYREMFRREAGHYKQMSQHPSGVFWVGAQVEEWPYYMVTEYLEGMTLEEYVPSTSSLTFEEGMAIALQLGRAVSNAHAKDVMHRDLKPENVFLTKGGNPGSRVRLLDYGLAKKFAGNQSDGLTQPGEIQGTLQYMAPEQFMSKPCDSRADVFALGLILYFIFSGGKHLFKGNDAMTAASERVMLTKQPPDLKEIDPRVAWVILRACSFEPKDRFPEASVLVYALETINAGNTAGEAAFESRMKSTSGGTLMAQDLEPAKAAPAVAPTMGIVAPPQVPVAPTLAVQLPGNGVSSEGKTVFEPPHPRVFIREAPAEEEVPPTSSNRWVRILGALIPILLIGGFFAGLWYGGYLRDRQDPRPPVTPVVIIPRVVAADASPPPTDASANNDGGTATPRRPRRPQPSTHRPARARVPRAEPRSPPIGINPDGTEVSEQIWRQMNPEQRRVACNWLRDNTGQNSYAFRRYCTRTAPSSGLDNPWGGMGPFGGMNESGLDRN